MRKRKDATADGYAYLTKRTVVAKAKAAGRKAAQGAMDTMGYVVTVKDGQVVKKYADGQVEILAKVPEMALPQNIRLG